MINPKLTAEVTAALDSTEEMMYESIMNANYFDMYKIKDRRTNERSLLYLYRYGLNLWMGEGVQPLLPEDSVVRILLRLEEVILDQYIN